MLVVGGSVYRSAIMKKRGNGIALLEKIEGTQPVFHTKEDFLSFIVSKMHPDVSVVGINFAYPLAPVFREGYLDGILQSGTKEHAFHGLMGEPVGETIEKAVYERLHQEIRVGIANDTICLLLSGLTQYEWHQIAAGIVGTGMNFALFLDDHTLVNLESANFDKFDLSPEVRIIDERSLNPGTALCEKEVAGAYLYQIFNEGKKRRGLNCPSLSSTDQIDELAKEKSDDPRVQDYANEVLQRSAHLVAAQIAGIVNFLKRDTAFIMEGSLFWKGYRYKERVEETVKQLASHPVSYVYLPDSGIMGAAKLVA
ncbi:MAG: hypothetical protein N3A54_05695 [Patescibacteria group bacterium]|nr:hypothetical protein [Patescibacteria group bacterium]